MTISKAIAVLALLLVAGCGGPDKVACDPALPQNALANREPPPPGFVAPSFLAAPCPPGDTKTAQQTTPAPAANGSSHTRDSSAAVSDR
jgi:hypothetical protein